MTLSIILLIILLLPLIGADRAYAGGGGGGSTTVQNTAPKSASLESLEGDMYNISAQLMKAYNNPAAFAEYSKQKELDEWTAKELGSTDYVSGATLPKLYNDHSLMGQLLNDATKKQFEANDRYNNLMSQAPQYTQKSNAALAQANSLLGQGADAVNQSKTAGDWYFNQAQGDYGNAQNTLVKADSEGDWYSNQAKNDYGNAQNYLAQAGTAGDWYYDQAKGDYGNAQNYLAQAGTAGDPWYGKAWDVYGQAEGLLGQLQGNLDYTSKANQWYDDYTREMLGGSKNMLDTGQIPQPIMDAMLSAMTTGVNQSVGSNINDLAARGVINSSVTNRGLADASRSVSDSMNANYLNAFNSLLSGYNQTAETGANAGRAFAENNFQINSAYNDAIRNATGLGDSYGATGSQRVNDLLGVAGGYTNNANGLVSAGSQRVNDLLGVAGGYTDNANGLSTAGANRVNSLTNLAGGYTNNANSLMDAGSQRISDWLNVSKGYNDTAAGYGNLSTGYLSGLDANMKERDQLLGAIPQYYENAMAPIMPAYNLMQTMQQDRWNGDKQDTVINQPSGPCFITTAVCEYFNKPDDCYELTALRHFRDMWLKFQPDGEELVKKYYEMAPRIVERLNETPDSERDAIYNRLWEDYIQPCIRHIEAREYEACKRRYIAMIDFLGKQEAEGE